MAPDIFPQALANTAASWAALSEHRQYSVPWIADLASHPWHRRALGLFAALMLLRAVVGAAQSSVDSGCQSQNGIVWTCFASGAPRTYGGAELRGQVGGVTNVRSGPDEPRHAREAEPV